MCTQSQNLNIQPIAVFGPQERVIDRAVRDQCSLMHIPHIQATMQQTESDDSIETPEDIDMEELFKKSISLNFYPPSDDISLAYAQLIKYYGWENFAVLYEDEIGNIYF